MEVILNLLEEDEDDEEQLLLAAAEIAAAEIMELEEGEAFGEVMDDCWDLSVDRNLSQLLTYTKWHLLRRRRFR